MAHDTDAISVQDEPVLSVERLRTLVQDAHLNFLLGAGAASPYFALLGGVEDALTELERSGAPAAERDVARASVQAYFFESVLERNVGLLNGDAGAPALLDSYGRFGRTLNRILLARRSTLLDKRVNLFTTNVDLGFEVAFERAGIEFNDGFAGRFAPVLDMSSFGSLRLRTSSRYDHRSEVPAFDLLKLHGSVGWVLEGSGSQIRFDATLTTVREVRETLDAARKTLIAIGDPGDIDLAALLGAAAGKVPTEDVVAFTAAFERLAIVAPEKTKFAATVLSQTYYELIRRFANELERENSLLLAHGFSFRDEHLRELVLRAARTNPTLQVVVFAYSEPAALEIRALLPEDAVRNLNLTLVAGSGLDLNALVDDWLEPICRRPSAPDAGGD
jgi:hypothetical protein